MKKNSLLVIVIFAVIGVFVYAVTEHLKAEECSKSFEEKSKMSLSVIKNLTEENQILRAQNDSLRLIISNK